MTMPGMFGGSVQSLTALNRRLIAQSSEGTTSVAEEAVEGDGFFDTGEDDLADPDQESEEDPEVRGRFSTEDPFEYNRVKEWIEASIELPSGMSSLVGAFVNEWAEQLAGEPVRDADGNIIDHRFPSANDIIANLDFQQGAAFLPFREQFDSLPAAFRTTAPDAEGNPVEYLVVNDPLRGPQFIESPVAPEQDAIREDSGQVQRTVIRTPFTSGSRVTRTPSEGGAAGADVEPTTTPVSGGAATPSEARGTVLTRESPVPSTTATPSEMRGVPMGPYIPPDILEGILNPPSSGGRGRGGGGGGGGMKRDLVFDRDQLLSQVADRYDRWMLEPSEAPAALVGGIVDDYIRKAKAFWVGKGGQLDFDTFVTGRLEALPRYKQIYKHKTPGQTPEEFLMQFMGPISGFGMSPERTRAETEIAVQTGTGPEAQAERVSRTREVTMSGGFSRRLAQTLAGLGISS